MYNVLYFYYIYIDMQCHIKRVTFVDQQTELKEIQSLPAMQRRRLSPLAKMVLHTARTVLQGESVDYIVWSSCYGDELTTASIIQDIAQGQTPSPTQFSISVHNAISGLYSILYQDDTPATSLSSAIQCSWQDALMEAYSVLKTQQKQQVLVVYYDAPLPDLYHYDGVQVTEMYAVGAIVSLEKPNMTLTVSADNTVQMEQQAQAFYQFWQETSQQRLQGQSWTFEKC